MQFFKGSYNLMQLMCAAAVLAGFAVAANSAIAGTILDYSPSNSGIPAPAYDPDFYGSSTAAEQQADRIMKAWKTESVTMPWTTLTLEMIVKHKVTPTRSARGNALVHVAMHDAWQLASDDATRRIAVSAAATQVLGYWFTAEEHGFDRILASVLHRLGAKNKYTAKQLNQGLQLGRQVGLRVIARGESDGAARGWNGVRLQWYGEGRYYGPGSWVPTAPYFYYPPDEPFANTWKTWVLESASQFRPTPPAFGSSKFIKDLQEVIHVNKNLTPEQLRIAQFWIDGSGSLTPTGHWNQLAQDMVRKRKLNEQQTVKLFAILNVSLADVFIAVWDCKYHYWTARPITMAKTVLGVDLMPPVLTPPFPSYVSAHSGFSGAASKVLGTYFPKDAKAFDKLAEEASNSRLYGGIHFRHDNEDGLVLGRAVAGFVLKKMQL